MAPKSAFHWNSTFKVKARLFNYSKRRSFKRRPCGLNISISRLDIPMNPFMPVFPHEDRCNSIAKSVVRLSCFREDDPSTDIHYPITPVIIFKAEKGSCRLLYADCGLSFGRAGSFELTFPDKQILVHPTDITKREKPVLIHEEEIMLVALSCEAREPSEPFQTIELGENVTMNQLVYLFDFRYGSPCLTEGNVAYADSSHFVLDSRPHDHYLYGALVFDINEKLVGAVYNHAGSPIAIQVNHLKLMLVELFPQTQMTPWSVGRNPSLRDVPSPPQPHAGEEEAALQQDAQASTMDAAADMTLEFAKKKLDDVYAKISPFIVGVRLESDPVAVGFIIHQTPRHYKIAVNSFVMRSKAISVQFADKKVALVDNVESMNLNITILYVKRDNGDPLLDQFDYADPSDDVCEKVVTFFPYMDGIAMFKGHIILNDSTCRRETPEVDFTFTCPYATTHLITNTDEMASTLHMTMGAPIFNLEGLFLGMLNYSGKEYDIKFAMNSCHFYNQLPKEIKGKKANPKDERKHTKDKHEEEDGTKGAKGKKSNCKDERKHMKDKHEEEGGTKGAKKGKKSNSKDERKHMKDKHEEEDNQYSVGSDIAHCFMSRHDDTPMSSKETHRLAVVNMDWDHIKEIPQIGRMRSTAPGRDPPRSPGRCSHRASSRSSRRRSAHLALPPTSTSSSAADQHLQLRCRAAPPAAGQHLEFDHKHQDPATGQHLQLCRIELDVQY